MEILQDVMEDQLEMHLNLSTIMEQFTKKIIENTIKKKMNVQNQREVLDINNLNQLKD